MTFRRRAINIPDDPRGRVSPSDHDSRVVIRLGREDDSAALERLRQRDTGTVPPEPQLVAELDGRILAARSLATGEAIADPFVRTAELSAMLAVRASQLAPRPPRRLVRWPLPSYARATAR
jgi:hypothetical protein